MSDEIEEMEEDEDPVGDVMPQPVQEFLGMTAARAAALVG